MRRKRSGGEGRRGCRRIKLSIMKKCSAAFIEPMDCLAVPKLPDDSQWVYEIKLDGYRAIAVKSAGKLNLFSRRRNSFNRQYPLVFEALADLPNNTVNDGEVVGRADSYRITPMQLLAPCEYALGAHGSVTQRFCFGVDR